MWAVDGAWARFQSGHSALVTLRRTPFWRGGTSDASKSHGSDVAPWSTTMRRVFHPETNGVKASPHRHKWMLSHGAPADPSDPWNSHAAPVSPRQTGHARGSVNRAALLSY